MAPSPSETQSSTLVPPEYTTQPQPLSQPSPPPPPQPSIHLSHQHGPSACWVLGAVLGASLVVKKTGPLIQTNAHHTQNCTFTHTQHSVHMACHRHPHRSNNSPIHIQSQGYTGGPPHTSALHTHPRKTPYLTTIRAVDSGLPTHLRVTTQRVTTHNRGDRTSHSVTSHSVTTTHINSSCPH